MDAERIVRLTPENVSELINAITVKMSAKRAPGRRRQQRWPFPGTVELWLPDECYGERHVLATLHNISPGGLAMRTRRPVPTDTRLSLAIHQPQMSLYGHAVTRHCTRASVGYLVGVEFLFTDSASED